MIVKEFYKSINGDYEDITARLPGDELVLHFLRQFPLDRTYDRLMDAVQKGDIKASFEATHNLKGLAANLSFTEFYDSLVDLCDQLRPQSEPAEAALIDRVTQRYNIILREMEKLEG